jgi:hypothetical protein
MINKGAGEEGLRCWQNSVPQAGGVAQVLPSKHSLLCASVSYQISVNFIMKGKRLKNNF